MEPRRALGAESCLYFLRTVSHGIQKHTHAVKVFDVITCGLRKVAIAAPEIAKFIDHTPNLLADLNSESTSGGVVAKTPLEEILPNPYISEFTGLLQVYCI